MACNSDQCCVCGSDIDQNNPPETSYFQGQTYCCCCPECKEQFEANPQMYAQRAAA